MQNHCAEIKVRAERRAGELLAEIDLHEGGKPNRLHDGTGKTKLEDIGITKSQSHRYQTIAAIPHRHQQRPALFDSRAGGGLGEESRGNTFGGKGRFLWSCEVRGGA